ncbi:SDR family oxidoreductase [Rossellomorea aquimaris]|uniref:SDR family oxidoreductase n=1 Tax=Rossellomorea aquimaris TaxID=189382 RepID=UPI0021E612DC
MKKLALVTGANSGFGMLSSLELAGIGYRVIATMRDPTNAGELLKRAEELRISKQILIEPLDVSSSESIKAFKERISHYSSIDLLLNNAGFAIGGFVEEVSIEEYREQFETNVFGVMAVTQAVLPFMRKEGKGKIINMGSISGRFGFPGLSPYVASKHALEGYSESLRLELKPFGIEVFLIEPGSFQTNIWTSGKKIAPRSLVTSSPYFSYMNKIESEMAKEKRGNPAEIAQIVRAIATGKIHSFRIPAGKGVRFTIFMKSILPWRMIEKVVLRKLKVR